MYLRYISLQLTGISSLSIRYIYLFYNLI